jgi:hypothetical protein
MKNYSLVSLFAIAATAFSYADSTAANTKTSDPHFNEYHNRISVFSPCYQNYERTKTDSIYAGVSAYYEPEINHDRRYLLNTELRMGYNYFFNGRDHLTPFAGVGYLQDFHTHHHHTKHQPGIVYGAVGFLYDHEFNTIFNLGFNMKLLLGGATSQKHFQWGSPVGGVDTSLPITFRFGRNRHWDYRIEPFNIYVRGSKASQDYFGFRNSIGYRF